MDGARVASDNVAQWAMGYAQQFANEAERCAGWVTDLSESSKFTANDWRADLNKIQDGRERRKEWRKFNRLTWREENQVLDFQNNGGYDHFELDPNPKTYAFINGTPLHKREHKPPPPRCALCLEDVKLDTMFTECAHMFCKSCCVRGHYLFDADNLKSCPVCRTEQPSSSIKIALYP